MIDLLVLDREDFHLPIRKSWIKMLNKLLQDRIISDLPNAVPIVLVHKKSDNYDCVLIIVNLTR